MYDKVTLATSVLVFSDEDAMKLFNQKAADDDLCSSISVPLIVVLAVLGLALLLSMMAVGFMFCRMKKRREERYPTFPPGYENKSYKP